MFLRKIDKILDTWLQQSDRRPLVLRGARQVGKSTSVRRLAARCGYKIIEIDLERYKKLDAVFATLDVEMILQEIQIIAKTKVNINTILFLDEAQGCPNSLAALRYFYENMPQLAVIAAGSLLEFTLSDHSYSMPVGRVDFVRMYPVTFSEYLLALGADIKLEIIENFINKKTVLISENAHVSLLRTFAEYCLIGGMPGAVANSLKYKQIIDKLEASALVHERLIMAFRDDFSKYSSRISSELMRKVMDALPVVAGCTRAKYSNICKGARVESTKKALNAILLAGLAKKITHTSARGIPLAASVEEDIFKLIPLDIGMSSTQSLGAVRTGNLPELLFAKWDSGNPIEKQWMGQLAECAVGQALLAQKESHNNLYYWLREGKSNNAEVDYVIQSGTSIIPIEVKSGASGSLRSLHQFMSERELKNAIRFDLNIPSIQNINLKTIVGGGDSVVVAYNLHGLPIYCADWVFAYIKARDL